MTEPRGARRPAAAPRVPSRRPAYRLRAIGRADVAVLVRLRSRMMRDVGRSTETQIRKHEAHFARWLRAALRGHRISGFVAEERQGSAVASGLMWLQPRPPGPRYPRLAVPYVMSMYTAPAYRRLGIATEIVRRLVAEARRRGFSRVELHATAAGRKVYARLGFAPTDQMRLELERSSPVPAEGRRRPDRGRRVPTLRGRSRSAPSRGTR